MQRIIRNLLSVATVVAAATATAQVSLPDGHPPLEQTSPQLPAATQPVSLGTLTIQAVQKTAGAAEPSSGKAIVEIYSQQHLLKKFELSLDSTGKATLPDLPVSFEIQPFVMVVYGGVEYSAQGSLMDSTHPNQQIDVPVYETIAEAPAWQIRMRHLMVHPAEQGLHVMDVVQIENPSDRAWTGITAEGGGKGTTFVLPLPPGAADVKLVQGFHECCTTIDQAGVHNQMALLPGVQLYRLTYTLPIQSGNVELSVNSPAPVQHLMVFVPKDGSKAQSEGLTETQSEMGDGTKRFFVADNLQAGQPVKLALAGVAASAGAAAGAGSVTASATTLAKAIAGAGSILILLLGGAFMFLKGPKTKRA